MQDWDRLAFLVVGAGIAIHTLYGGWKLWRQENRGGALGALFLALVAIAVPIGLMVFAG